MKNKSIPEFGTALVLVGLMLAVLNPMHVWMPTMAHMTMLAAAIVVFGLYAAFIMREQAADERDNAHRMHSGRFAYLMGAGVLLAGIIYQSYWDMLDIWLVVVLVSMVIAKIAAHLYSDRNF